jgi:hypothetical protein
MSKCNCGSPKCPFNALVGDIDSEIRSGGSRPTFAKAMTRNAAEAHTIAVREHAKLSLAALEAVRAGKVSLSDVVARGGNRSGHRSRPCPGAVAPALNLKGVAFKLR